MVVVAAHRLGEQVERPCRDHDVVDVGEFGEPVGDTFEVAGRPDADHRLSREAQLQGVGDSDDLHDARVEHALYPLPDRRLRQPHSLADRRVRPSPVLLQLLDDLLGDVVEQWVRPVASRVPRMVPPAAAALPDQIAPTRLSGLRPLGLRPLGLQLNDLWLNDLWLNDLWLCGLRLHDPWLRGPWLSDRRLSG